MEKSRDCRNSLRNQRGSSWGAVIQNNGHKTLNLNKFRFNMGIIYFGLMLGGEREEWVGKTKSHSVCVKWGLRIAIQRGELEWRQGGELWEQGRIHWKLFEAKKPGKGSCTICLNFEIIISVHVWDWYVFYSLCKHNFGKFLR